MKQESETATYCLSLEHGKANPMQALYRRPINAEPNILHLRTVVSNVAERLSAWCHCLLVLSQNAPSLATSFG